MKIIIIALWAASAGVVLGALVTDILRDKSQGRAPRPSRASAFVGMAVMSFAVISAVAATYLVMS